MKTWMVLGGMILFLGAIVYFFAWAVSGVYQGNAYLNGVVIDRQTKQPIPDVTVTVSNRGWGISEGRLVWDHDYEYSMATDQQGRFHVDYQVGPSAHVIVTQDGYERYDEYFDRNSTITIELKPKKPTIYP